MDIKIEGIGKVSRIEKTTPNKSRDVKLREWYYQRGLQDGKTNKGPDKKVILPDDVPSEYRMFYIKGFKDQE